MKRMLNSGIIVFAVLIIVGCGSTSDADIVLFNGRIFTGDSTKPWVKALAIRENRIIATGDDSIILLMAGSKTKRIDLEDHVAVPGFNDAHTHVGPDPISKLFINAGDDLPNPTLPQLLDSLKLAAKSSSPGEWLLAYVGPEILNSQNSILKSLDEVAPNNPVELYNFTGHGCILNSFALNDLSISNDVSDPVGGWFERDKNTAMLTGRINGYACFDVLLKRTASISDSACADAYRSFIDRALKYGITSVQDMANSLTAERTLRNLNAAAPRIRWRVIRWPNRNPKQLPLNDWKNVSAPANSLIKVSGTKWVLDGTQIERFAVMRKPYPGKTEWYGRFYFPKDTIRTLISEALSGNDLLLLHAIGDSTITIILQFMSELAPDSVWRARRVRVEHGNFMKPDQYERVKALGIVIVTNPSHYEENDPVRSLIEHDIPLAIGSDGPTNPFLNIMFATDTSRRTTNDTKITEAITREQAVTAYTRGSAFAEFAANEKGVLSVGMFADIAVLSIDIFSVPAQELPGAKSLLTLVGGKIEYDSGVLKVK